MTEQATKAVTVFDRVATTLDSKRDQIVAMYGGDAVLADRMRMVALHALADPKLAWKLQRADFATVIEALRESATLGLMPIGSTAEGYLVPRRNSAKSKAAGGDVYDITFLPGWRGLLKLTYRSKLVTAVDTDVVYEADDFDFEKGTTPYLRHKRVLRDRGNVIATYAIAYLRDGPPIFEIMDEAEMAMVQSSSSSRDYETKDLIGPWLDWPDEMRRKSAVRRLDKRLPLEHLAERALQYEAEIDERYGEQARIEGAERRQLPASAASVARGAFTGEAVADGAGAEENGSTATDTADGADGASAADSDGQATCGAVPPDDYTGGPCSLGSHTAPMHRNAAGETWESDR